VDGKKREKSDGRGTGGRLNRLPWAWGAGWSAASHLCTAPRALVLLQGLPSRKLGRRVVTCLQRFVLLSPFWFRDGSVIDYVMTLVLLRQLAIAAARTTTGAQCATTREMKIFLIGQVRNPFLPNPPSSFPHRPLTVAGTEGPLCRAARRSPGRFLWLRNSPAMENRRYTSAKLNE
jgi:hypothetical protein